MVISFVIYLTDMPVNVLKTLENDLVKQAGSRQPNMTGKGTMQTGIQKQIVQGLQNSKRLRSKYRNKDARKQILVLLSLMA